MHSTIVKTAALYARVSTSDQASEEKCSLDVQLSDGRALCHERGYTVAAEFVDASPYRSDGRLVQPSGTRTDRPDFRAMLEFVRGGRAGVIVAWREDRLYRSLKAASMVDDLIEETGVTIELVKEHFDRSMLGFKAAIGRYELTAIKERLTMGREARARSGLPPTGVSPAYRKLIDANGETTGYEFKQEYREFFDRLAACFLDGASFNRIALAIGDNPLNGKRLDPEAVRRILRDPFHRGLIAYGHKARDRKVRFTAPGKHTPVWDPETIDRLERELERRDRVGRSFPRSPDAIFTGILRCGFCGRAMGSQLISFPGEKPVRAYGCKQPKKARLNYDVGPPHPSNYIRETRLLKVVRAQLEAPDTGAALELFSPSPDRERHAWLERQSAKLEQEAGELRQELKRIRSQVAYQALSAELDRVLAQAAELEREALDHAPPAFSLEEHRAEMIRLRDDPAVWNWPPVELRRILQQTLGTLYVRRGILIPEPTQE